MQAPNYSKYMREKKNHHYNVVFLRLLNSSGLRRHKVVVSKISVLLDYCSWLSPPQPPPPHKSGARRTRFFRDLRSWCNIFQTMVIHQCQVFVESSCISVALNVFNSISVYKLNMCMTQNGEMKSHVYTNTGTVHVRVREWKLNDACSGDKVNPAGCVALMEARCNCRTTGTKVKHANKFLMS